MSLLAATVLAVAIAHAQSSIDQVVRQFVPAMARVLDPDESDVEDVTTCAAVLEADGGGEPRVIAAAYIGFSTGRLSILERQADGSFAVVDGEEIPGDGKPCELKIVRFERTGPPAIFLTVPMGMWGHHWEGLIFQWNGKASRDLERGLALGISGMHDPQLLDVRHDGTHEIVTSVFDYDVKDVRAEGLPTHTFDARDLVEAWWVCIVTCEKDAAWLTQPDGRGRYTLRLVNGERGGTNRVRVSSVTLNGRERLPRTARGSDAEFIDVPLGAGLKAGTAVRVRATPIGPDGRLVAVLILQP